MYTTVKVVHTAVLAILATLSLLALSYPTLSQTQATSLLQADSNDKPNTGG
jgi:hypothetical protein